MYEEGDVSAFGLRPRPEFARLLTDIASHRIDMVIAWHPDRIYRRQRDLVPFIDTVQAAGASVATVETGELDLASPSGRMVARIVGALAEHESERRAERLRFKHEELARAGRWPGGKRPYGYRYVGDGMLQVVPEEALIIREAADRLIGGESVSSVCRDLTRRDVPTAKGGLWYPDTLVGVLTKPSVYGYRMLGGEPTRGVWEPILDKATVDQITELTARLPDLATSAKLLCSLLRCGRCGSTLKSSGRNAYMCRRPPEGRGCGTLWITSSRADAAVLLEVCERLGTDHHARTSRGLLARPSSRSKAQPGTGQTLDDPATWRAPVSMTGDGSDWTVNEQRLAIRSVVDRIVVRPAAQQGGRFDPSRVTDGIVWREPS